MSKEDLAEKFKDNMEAIIVIMAIVALSLSVFNMFQISNLKSYDSDRTGGTGAVTTGDSIIPNGVPEVYGDELKFSFDDISPSDQRKADAAIRKLAQLDRSILLSGDDLDRYVNSLYRLEGGISCEYCCGARSVIFENGRAACGCAHSFAMRGLAKYLITEHGEEYSDEEILAEVGKLKTLFFPGQMTQKAEILEEKGVESNYINLASNKYRGIEKGALSGGGMVGGC